MQFAILIQKKQKIFSLQLEKKKQLGQVGVWVGVKKKSKNRKSDRWKADAEG